MEMQYVNYIRSKILFITISKLDTPILNKEDEAFLNRIIFRDNLLAFLLRLE